MPCACMLRATCDGGRGNTCAIVGTAAVRARLPRAPSRSLLAYAKRLLLRVPRRGSRRQHAEAATMTRLMPSKMSVAGMDGKRCRRPKRQNDHGEYEGDDCEDCAPPLTRSHRAQSQEFGFERQLEQTNASHGAAPIGQRRSSMIWRPARTCAEWFDVDRATAPDDRDEILEIAAYTDRQARRGCMPSYRSRSGCTQLRSR